MLSELSLNPALNSDKEFVEGLTNVNTNPCVHRTAVFSEYQCWGKGADTSQRVPWLKSFSFEEAQPYLNMTFIDGNQWLRL